MRLAPLPYPPDTLEPAISAHTVTLHHDKHQRAYVDGVNATLDRLDEVTRARYPPEARRPMRRALAATLAFNLGGAVLHEMYFASLTRPGTSRPPSPQLAAALQRDLGSPRQAVEALTDISMAMQGPGWAVLAYSPHLDRLIVLSVGSHDQRVPPGVVVLLPLDAWEHAYYLDRGPDKGAYLDALWSAVDWAVVSGRYARAVGS